MTEDAGVARFTTGGVEFLRTPEDRFLGLPDFDYEPSFLDLIDLPEQSRLFAQDWGGLLGLRLVAERPNQFGHVAIGNTALPTGQSAGEGFDAWLAYSQSPQFAAPESIGRLFRRRRPTPPDLHTGRTLRPRRPRRGHRSRSSRLVEPCRLTRPHLWRPQPAVGHH